MRAVPDDARYVGARDQGVAHGANSAMVTMRAASRMLLINSFNIEKVGGSPSQSEDGKAPPDLI